MEFQCTQCSGTNIQQDWVCIWYEDNWVPFSPVIDDHTYRCEDCGNNTTVKEIESDE